MPIARSRPTSHSTPSVRVSRWVPFVTALSAEPLGASLQRPGLRTCRRSELHQRCSSHGSLDRLARCHASLVHLGTISGDQMGAELVQIVREFDTD